MPFLRWRKLIRSVRYARAGLVRTWKDEQNFRIQVVVGALTIIAAFVLRLSPLRFILVVVLVTMVLVLELLNTFFERLVDLLSPRVHHYAEMLKDLLAAVVLVASLGASIVGLLLFWPYLVAIVSNFWGSVVG